MGSKKCQGEVGIENLPKKKKKTEKGKRKRGRSAIKHKKSEKIIEKQALEG